MKIVVIILILAGLAYVLFRYISGQKYKKSFFGTQKIREKSPRVLLGGNVFANWWLEEHAVFLSFRSKKNERNLYMAFLIKWILEGKITVIPNARSKRRLSMALKLDNPFTDRTEMNLYEMLLAASGNDYVLEVREFMRWARRNFKLIDQYPNRADVRGKRYLISKGYMTEDKKAVPDKYPQMRECIEFKNYLKSFDLSLAQPKAGEWKDYLVLGALFGCMDKMLKQLYTQIPAGLRDYSRSIGLDPAELLSSIEGAKLMATKGFNAAKEEQERDEEKRNSN